MAVGLQSMSADMGGASRTADLSQPNNIYSKPEGCHVKNMNETMPAGGINTNSSNTIKQSSLENAVRINSNGAIRSNQIGLMNLQNQLDTNESQAKLNNKINMEAYQAYYNTNESAKGGQAPTGMTNTIGTF